MKTRTLHVLNIAIVLFSTVSVYCLAVACSPGTVDRPAIAADGVVIALCQAEVRLCRDGDGGKAECWKVYDSCMISHGLKDGGK